MATLNNISNPVWGLSVVGYGVIVEGLAAIRQRMDIAIRTTKGTDPMRNEFGSNVYSFIDRKISIAVPNIKKEILSALQIWVPEIRVISISHSFPEDYSNPQFEIVYRLTDDDLVDKLLIDVRDGITSIPDQLSELTLQAYFPLNPNGYRYTLKFERNGSQIFPMPNPSGFVTIEELYDWAKTNLFYVGKWYLLSDKIVCYMKAEGVKSASISIEVLPITIIEANFPTVLPGEAYKLILKINDQEAVPLCPQIFESPGDVLQWVQNNWGTYASWAIEFMQATGEGFFSDEFSDEMQVAATGFRLIGISNILQIEANLQITKVVSNKFQAQFPDLGNGEHFSIVFKKDGLPVNPNVPSIYSSPDEILNHAKTYWNNLADWGIRNLNTITGSSQVQDVFNSQLDPQIYDFYLIGIGHTSFNAELTITKI